MAFTSLATLVTPTLQTTSGGHASVHIRAIMSEGDAADQPAAQHAVAIKLPPFWAHQPRVWFAQAEAQFALHDITVDSTKYAYLVSALPEDVTVRALDYIESMVDSASTDKYKGLKDRLLGTFTPSDYERAGMLIHGPDLGDDKPSALMDKMLALLGDHEPCLLFKRLFLERLPAQVRAPLLHGSETDMRKLAEQADLTWQALKGPTDLLMHAVAAPDESEVNKIASSKGNPAAKGRSFLEWSRNWQQTPGGPCVFHAFYGSRARKCVSPCSATRPGNASADRQ